MTNIFINGSETIQIPQHQSNILDGFNDAILSLFKSVPYLNEFITKLSTPYTIIGNHTFTIYWAGGILFATILCIIFAILRKSNVQPLCNKFVAILISFFISVVILFRVV